MMIRTTLVAVLLSAAAAGQTVSPGLEHANPEMADPFARREAQTRVEEFLHALGRRDVAAIRGMLAPKALIAVVGQRPDGTFMNTYSTGEEFLEKFEKSAGQPPFEEPITNVRVTVDSGRLAHLRADFTIVRNGKVVSSGVDHFTLLKEPDGWKIAVVAYTSLPAR